MIVGAWKPRRPASGLLARYGEGWWISPIHILDPQESAPT